MALDQELVEQVFEGALALEPQARTAYLDRVCGGDRRLKAAVEELLTLDANAGSLLEHPPVNGMFRSPNGTTPSPGSTGSLGDGHSFSLPYSLQPGEVLTGRFMIVRFIAKGGMGEVYEAEDRLLQGARIALKTILPQIANDPLLRHRFEQEVLLARQVNHPNLCPVHDIFYSEPLDLLFLTMKLIPGETLSARLRKGPIPAEEGLSILKQMAAGLDAIHDAGIVHRDIKPNNIMLEGSGAEIKVSITDFGLARAYEGEHSLPGKGIVAGTPDYMAPELFNGGQPSQASDLFAFGVVLHQVCTGRRPDWSPDHTSVLVSPRLQSSGLPAFCVQLVSGCLNPSPTRRCQAFERGLTDLHIYHRPRALWTRRQFAFAAASAMVATAGTTWWKWNDLENFWRPLPAKRFVALLSWPRTSDLTVTPMLTSVLNAIKSQLTHVEALDRDFFMISPEDAHLDLASITHLREISDPLGVNLVLAASGIPSTDNFQLFLRLLDPISGHALRQRRVSCPLAAITSLPARAVVAAASLLNIVQNFTTEKLQEADTQSPEAFVAYQTAETLLKQPHSGLEGAIEKYKQAIDLDSRYAMAYARLSQAYTRYYLLHRSPAAIDLARGNCQTALDLSPDLVDGHLAQAAIFQYTGNEEGALRAIDKALLRDPSNARALVWQAQIFNRLNRWDEADGSFRRILREHPNSWLAYNEFGYVLDLQGRYQEAVQAFRSSSLAAPNNSLALSNLGGEYLQIGRFVDGADLLKKCLSIDPACSEAAVYLSLALRYQGKYKEALVFARKAVDLNPDEHTYWLELADCLLSLRNHGQAKEAYIRAAKEAERLLSLDPADGPARILLALYKVKTGSPRDAPSLIEKAESFGARDVNSQMYKGRIWELLGKRDEALATFAACFRTGASDIQVAAFPDMRLLRNDPRYRQLSGANVASPEAGGF
jgi:eukaryotic-like serine/threonine-protein kinase